jgi:alcohol dehydrogenase class IV
MSEQQAIQPFIYTANAARVIFGAGRTSELANEIRGLKCSRALVLTTIQQEQSGKDLLAQLGEVGAALYPGAVMHTPVDVTEKALAFLREHQVDCLVALGGGSTTGLSKALALRTGLPQIAIPTTYAGSEVTPILGETQAGLKTTQRKMSLLPQVVIYDVEQTLSLPPGLSASSGLNAMAHAVEALYARDANPIVSLMAEAGIGALAHSLPVIVEKPADLAARTNAQYGAWLCGTCLGLVGMALHHKICHVLGGTFDLPHAETHSILLPHTVAYNTRAVPQAMARVAAAMGTSDAATGLYALLRKLKIPTALRDIGMPESGIDKAVELACRDSYWNPRPLEAAPLRKLIQNAFNGSPPVID